MSNKHGSGSLYLRGTTWWIRYSHRGAEFRESSGSESETVARRLLNARIKETGKRGGRFLGQAEERLRFDDLADMLRNDYVVNNRRSLRRVKVGLKQLANYFGLDRAVDITTDRVGSYIVQRRKDGAANATINRELSALKRAFKIAVDAERLSRAPHISMLEEQNARQGFLEHGQFLALHAELPDDLKDPIEFLYRSGWRVGEMKTLEWADVDLAGQAVRLPPAKSKNADGRTLPLSGPLTDVIARASERRRLDCPYVFLINGRPIADFRAAWDAARTAAGLGHLLVHDLRRSAVRNMIRGRVPERVAMAISGHKTRSMFDRYNIVSESDLRDAMQQRDEYLDSRPTDPKVVPLVRTRKRSRK
ncbi:MAG TPA: tyrosine-type recombinase/integrase [Candidatus Binatus sp.]|uniref:tyrosine-type recombinase/integrase n=1 Tax=Candidatus Binatus sp. TaxID=2811406 RepID=UPI002B46ACCD|nr:tyrosine-type recombinase/integrase [Candidatus Binatus sp.]HKN12797.1 tyrosine-type recombinase/integrase [Candidatus Binatus sp.]